MPSAVAVWVVPVEQLPSGVQQDDMVFLREISFIPQGGIPGVVMYTPLPYVWQVLAVRLHIPLGGICFRGGT
ncbi:hypothetical protein GCM10023079_37470 [Streptomyces chitinivorans]